MDSVRCQKREALMYSQITESAIAIVLGENHLFSPGDVVAHASDQMTYEFYKYENGMAVVGFNGVTKSFPMGEVFDPNVVREVAEQILLNSILPSMN
jgi:hypothetical protein